MVERYTYDPYGQPTIKSAVGTSAAPARQPLYVFDADLNGCIDDTDEAHLDDCLDGTIPDATCVLVHDYDGDGDVDLDDDWEFTDFRSANTNGTPAPEDWLRPAPALGDVDRDGNLDQFDILGLQQCFASDLPESVLCNFIYDANGNGDVDLDDYHVLIVAAAGPLVTVPKQDHPSRYGNPYLFTGQRYDAETGLYLFPHRVYSATWGRWYQRDPQGVLDLVGEFLYDPRTGQITWFRLETNAGDEYSDMLNLYQYAMLNPVLFVDPTGRSVSLWLANTFLEATGGDDSWLDDQELVYKVSMGFGIAGAAALGGAFIVASAPAIVSAAQSFQMMIATAGSGGGATLLSRWPGPNGGRQIINGITYTVEALTRMMPRGLTFAARFQPAGNFIQSRGVPPSVVENAIRWGSRTAGNKPGTLKIVYDNVVVITNEAANRVITVITTGR